MNGISEVIGFLTRPEVQLWAYIWGGLLASAGLGVWVSRWMRGTR